MMQPETKNTDPPATKDQDHVVTSDFIAFLKEQSMTLRHDVATSPC
jgi:hypothetical protein